MEEESADSEETCRCSGWQNFLESDSPLESLIYGPEGESAPCLCNDDPSDPRSPPFVYCTIALYIIGIRPSIDRSSSGLMELFKKKKMVMMMMMMMN